MTVLSETERLFDRLESVAALLPVSHIPAAQDVQRYIGAVIAFLEHGETILDAADGGDPTQQSSLDRVHAVIAGDTPINPSAGIQPSAATGPAMATSANVSALAEQIRTMAEQNQQREQALMAQVQALIAVAGRSTATSEPVPDDAPDSGLAVEPDRAPDAPASPPTTEGTAPA